MNDQYRSHIYLGSRVSSCSYVRQQEMRRTSRTYICISRIGIVVELSDVPNCRLRWQIQLVFHQVPSRSCRACGVHPFTGLQVKGCASATANQRAATPHQGCNIALCVRRGRLDPEVALLEPALMAPTQGRCLHWGPHVLKARISSAELYQDCLLSSSQVFHCECFLRSAALYRFWGTSSICK